MKQIRVQYFALLREQAGCAEQIVATHAATAAELYSELRTQHRFTLPENLVKVAIADEFAEMTTPLPEHATLVFIPPVAGG